MSARWSADIAILIRVHANVVLLLKYPRYASVAKVSDTECKWKEFEVDDQEN